MRALHDLFVGCPLIATNSWHSLSLVFQSFIWRKYRSNLSDFSTPNIHLISIRLTLLQAISRRRCMSAPKHMQDSRGIHLYMASQHIEVAWQRDPFSQPIHVPHIHIWAKYGPKRCKKDRSSCNKHNYKSQPKKISGYVARNSATKEKNKRWWHVHELHWHMCVDS